MSEPSITVGAGGTTATTTTDVAGARAGAPAGGQADPVVVGGPASGPGIANPELIERVLGRLTSMGEPHGPDAPGWLAQELTFGQLRVLFLLSKQGPAPMSRVAEWLGVGMPTASGVVERIERHGLAAREHRPDDRRIVECRLTDAGRALIADITGRQLESMRRILALLTPDELIQLDRIIGAVVERRRADAP